MYNKWHETELERWLSDHGTIFLPRGFLMEWLTCHSDIPYPSPADRKDLETLVKSNWESKVQKPLGHAAEHATDSWHNAKEWIFDT